MTSAARNAVLAFTVIAVGGASFFGARAAVLRLSAPTHRDPTGELVRALDLTADQEREVRALHASMAGRNRASAARVEECSATLCDIIRSQDPDPARVEAYLQATHDAQDDVQREVVCYLLEVRKCLSDEQANRLADLVGESVRWNCTNCPCIGPSDTPQGACGSTYPPPAPVGPQSPTR